jgi:hypothetical protein
MMLGGCSWCVGAPLAASVHSFCCGALYPRLCAAAVTHHPTQRCPASAMCPRASTSAAGSNSTLVASALPAARLQDDSSSSSRRSFRVRWQPHMGLPAL